MPVPITKLVVGHVDDIAHEYCVLVIEYKAYVEAVFKLLRNFKKEKILFK